MSFALKTFPLQNAAMAVGVMTFMVPPVDVLLLLRAVMSASVAANVLMICVVIKALTIWQTTLWLVIVCAVAAVNKEQK
jgi:hypothetical protein